MGFRVIKVKRERGPQFKVMFEWYESGARKTRGITKDDWIKHGFRFDMSPEQAAEHMKLLNAREQAARTERRNQSIKKRLDDERTKQSALLPEELVRKFEEQKLSESTKTRSYWNKVRRILTSLNLQPQDWEDQKELFYKKFLAEKMSPAYIQKVLPLINKWGMFYARKVGQAFIPIPAPPRSWAHQLNRAHNRKESSRGNKKSDVLKPVMLYQKKAALRDEHYRWLYLTVWFGLRPIEVDSLMKPSGKFTWKLREVSGEKRLYVFQTKLEGQGEDKEWKAIPVRTPEQLQALSFIGQPLERPSHKIMHARFGPEITLYGGRQGFTKLMKFFGVPFEDTSRWLGHTDVTRTYQSYFKRLDEDYTDEDVYLKPTRKAA